MNSACIFCAIAKGEIPAKIAYQDQFTVAFHHLAPQAKNHLLFIHRQHSHNIDSMLSEDTQQLVQVMQAITNFAKQEGLVEKGFRIVNNCGPDAGQTVFHTHFHVLYGERLGTFGSKMN